MTAPTKTKSPAANVHPILKIPIADWAGQIHGLHLVEKTIEGIFEIHFGHARISSITTAEIRPQTFPYGLPPWRTETEFRALLEAFRGNPIPFPTALEFPKRANLFLGSESTDMKRDIARVVAAEIEHLFAQREIEEQTDGLVLRPESLLLSSTLLREIDRAKRPITHQMERLFGNTSWPELTEYQSPKHYERFLAIVYCEALMLVRENLRHEDGPGLKRYIRSVDKIIERVTRAADCTIEDPTENVSVFEIDREIGATDPKPKS